MNKTGFIGLGIMGMAMAENLLKANIELMVNDIQKSAVAVLEKKGAIGATPAKIGACCDVIFLSLPNGSVSQEILFGRDGVCSSIRPGTVICDTSSVTPAESRYCYDQCAARGVKFLDAPVSGGEEGAQKGNLALMCGGDQETFDQLVPYFKIIGKSALLTGGSGSGSVAKLANQVIVNNTIAIVSEALVFAAKAGADPEKIFQAIRGGLAGSQVLEDKVPRMISHNFVPGGKISINHKDIKNALAYAHTLDVPMPYTAQLFEILQALKVRGHMNNDHAGILQFFEELADIRLG